MLRTWIDCLAAVLVLAACRAERFSQPTLAIDAHGILVVSVINGSNTGIHVKDQPHFILAEATAPPRELFWAPVNLMTGEALHLNENVLATVPSGPSRYDVPQANLRWALQRSAVWPTKALGEVAKPGNYALSVVAFGSRSSEIAVMLDEHGQLKSTRQ